MTIVPEPRIRILWRSSRLGMGADLLEEAVEEIEAVVRSRPRLGVVLDGAAGDVGQRQALDGAVIEVEVRQLRGAEVGLPAHGLVGVDRAFAARPEHSEAVVLARDLLPPGLEVLDR